MDKNNVDTAKELPTVISFCSGYGGIERGLDLAGVKHRVLAYVEIEAFAIANLVNKMENGLIPPAPIYTDLKTFPAHIFRGCVDILTGGYPCQPFSAAGKRLGTEDPRHLWPYILDHINAIRPVRCFFENVEGHISLGLREVIDDLEGAGYRTTWGIFSAAEVGAPHQRKRVYILADSKSAGSRPNGNGGKVLSEEVLITVQPQRETLADANSPGYDTRGIEAVEGWQKTVEGWRGHPQFGSSGRSEELADTRDPRPSRAGIEPQPGIKIIEPCDSDSTGECGPDMANADRARQQTQRRESGAERETGLAGEPSELANTSSQRFGGESQGQLQQPGRAEVVSAGEELADTKHLADSAGKFSERRIAEGVASWKPEEAIGDRGAFASVADTVSEGSQGWLSGREDTERKSQRGHLGRGGTALQRGQEQSWPPEPSVGQLVNGNTSRLDGLRRLGINANERWLQIPCEKDAEACLRELRKYTKALCPPHRSGLDEQQPFKYTDALQFLSHVGAPPSGGHPDSGAETAMSALRQNILSAGVVLDTSDAPETLWESLADAEKAWIAMATCHGCNWESIPIGRVTTECPNRVDRIRQLGNGVVPQTAAKAWTTLTSRGKK
jgi:site-specific DNA-cytosine methylase